MNAPESNLLTFPVKLKCIVDSPETDHLIYWDEDGSSFHITDENQLARDVIPNYFKHNNISSFIRQLNMYGFHKINRIENGLAVIGNGKDDSQWSHPFFIRDKPELLQNISRKVTNSQFLNSLKPNSNDMELVTYDSVKSDIAQLVKAVQYLKQRDEETSEKLKTLQEEKHQLYSVMMYLQEEHDKQSKLIDILVNFFSLCANNQPETRLKSKRVFAIEMPNSKPSTITNLSEPPKKYFVTSPSSCGQSSVSNDDKNSFKGKKLIKITPTTILRDNRICGLPIISNTQQNPKPPQLLSISLPKPKNNIIIPTRSFSSTGNTTNKPPTIVIHQPKCNTSNISINNVPKKSVSKTVTVSSIDSQSSNLYKPINDISVKSAQVSSSSSPNNGGNIFIGNCKDSTNCFKISQLKEPDSANGSTDRIVVSGGNSSPNIYDTAMPFDGQFESRSDVSNMISDINSNVSSVGKSLKQITQSLKNNSNYLSKATISNNDSNVLDYNFDLADGNFSVDCGQNQSNNSANDDGADETMEYEELKMLLENIKNENFEDEFLVSDPGKIQGHELIPFSTYQNDWPEPVYNYQDNFSVDDLLQTPEICPEESSLSLNDLKYSLFPSNSFNEKSLP